MLSNIKHIFRPPKIKDALALLQEYRPHARFLAGGTDITLTRDERVHVLIDIGNLGLDYIRQQQGWVRIGAGTRIATLEHSPVIKGFADGLLAKVASSWGSLQVSNQATIGGNLAKGGATADMAAPLLAMNARCVLAGKKRRIVPVSEFWTAAGTARLGGDLLTEIVIPRIPLSRATWMWEKFVLSGDAIAIVSVTVALQRDSKGVCTSARIVLGAATPSPRRCPSVERVLMGRRIDDKNLFQSIVAELRASLQPIDDLRASSEYRRTLFQVLLRRILDKQQRRS
jgi:xanthine dehydrogenase small subunit